MNEKMTIKMLMGLASAFDALLLPDFYIHTHHVLTSTFVKALGNKLGIYGDDAEVLWLGARMHDIGKIRMLSTFNECKKIKLDRHSPEFALMKTHTLAGESFFKNMLFPMNGNLVLAKMALMAKSHHERPDGKGYPMQLKEGQIPIFASVAAVVDSLAAMVGPERSYRAGMTLDEAVKEIERCAGTQFDPLVVEAFLDILPGHKIVVKEAITDLKVLRL